MATMNRYVSDATLRSIERQIEACEKAIKEDIELGASLEDQITATRARVEGNEAFKRDLQLLIHIAPRKV